MAQIDSKQMDAPIGEVSAAHRHKAARHVASSAYDATDAHDLLDKLGLLDALVRPVDDAA